MHESREEKNEIRYKGGNFMKRIFKNIVSVLLLLCLAFSIASCGEETGTSNSSTPYEEPDNQISYTHANIDGRVSLNEPISAIIRTEEELIEVFSKIEVEWENEPIWERYDEDFFETKAFLFDLAWASGTHPRSLAYVCIENDKIILYIDERLEGNMVNEVSFIYPVFVEVNKEDIANAVEIVRKSI